MQRESRDLVFVEANVRGIKFYGGFQELGTFVHVTFAREYDNTNDPNSILVRIKKSNNILGHLERKVASGITKIMDQHFSELVLKGYVFCVVDDFCIYHLFH